MVIYVLLLTSILNITPVIII